MDDSGTMRAGDAPLHVSITVSSARLHTIERSEGACMSRSSRRFAGWSSGSRWLGLAPFADGAGRPGACGRRAARTRPERTCAEASGRPSVDWERRPRSRAAGGRHGLPGARPADVPGGDRRLGRAALLPDPDRRRRADLQVPPGVPARAGRALPARGAADVAGRQALGPGRRRGRPVVGRRRAAARPTLPPGDAVPRRLGPTPPGVVVSAPDSPMLAGAVALAAGRFQPLIRWEIPDTVRRRPLGRRGPRPGPRRSKP